jgi:flagellar biosynthesis protein FliR
MAPINIELAEVFPILLVLARVTGAVLMLPGLGSQYINTPVRVLFCMAIAAVISPMLMDNMPQAPEEPYLFFSYVIIEALIGAFIGIMGRMLLSSLEVAGSVIGFQSGLMNAFVMNPVEGRQSSLPATYLSTIVLALIFISDLHHLALQAVYDSYQIFQPGSLAGHKNLSQDFMQSVVRIIGEAFILGTQIAAPIIILSMLFFIGMGLLNRLMPQLQVFFIAQPFQIFLGFLILSMLVSSACMSVIERLSYLYANLWTS